MLHVLLNLFDIENQQMPCLRDFYQPQSIYLAETRGNRNDIIGLFGDAKAMKDAVEEMQRLLYAA